MDLTPTPSDTEKNHLLRLARLMGLHLVPFILLALGVVMALEGWFLPYFGATRSQPDDHLVWVDPSGPAAQAGLQTGDVLLTVDEEPIDERSPLWDAQDAGRSLTVRFLRAGQPRTAQVIPAFPPPGERAQRMSTFLIAFSFWLIGTVVLFLRPGQPDARRFGFQSLMAAMVLTPLPLVSVQVDWATRLNAVAVVWVTTLLIDLHTLFPMRLGHRRMVMRTVYILGGVLTGVYLLWDPLARMNSAWGIHLSNAVIFYFVAAVLLSLVLLTRAYWRAPTATVRRRVRLVLAGTSLALLPPCGLLFIPLLMGLPPLIPDALGLLSLVLIPLAYAYGIYRYNLMGIDFLINRMVVYLTLGLLLLAIYFAVALIVLALTGTAVLLAGALASVIAVAVVTPLRQRVDLAWERVFYPDVYGYRGAVDTVSRRLSEALDYSRLASLLVRELGDAMDLEGTALLLVREEHLTLQEATGTLRVLGRSGDPLLSARGTLAQCLAQAGAPVDADSLPISDLRFPISDFSSSQSQTCAEPGRSTPNAVPISSNAPKLVLSHAEGSEISNPKSQIRLWVPLVVAGELQGALLLGAKRTDEFFSPQDRQLLRALAGQAALAVKNVGLVAERQARMDEIARDRRALQLAYWHLARSREHERRHLAGDLHDDVIQPLVGLHYDLDHYARAAGGDVGRGLQGLTGRVSDIITRIRHICGGLWPQVLDLGLVQMLRSHLRTFRAETGLEVELEADEVPRLPEEVQVFLFRMAQEALNNVRRHAHASAVYVRLTVTPEALELSVTDDGIGFVPARGRQEDPGTVVADSDEHFGLRFMREYVEALGGQFTLHARPGQGTTVIARVPRAHFDVDACAGPAGRTPMGVKLDRGLMAQHVAGVVKDES